MVKPNLPGQLQQSLKLIFNIAEQLEVELIEVDDDYFNGLASAAFCYHDMSIRYSTNILDNLEHAIYVLAHELGHAIDYQEMNIEEQSEYVESVRLYNDCLMLDSEFPYGMKEFVLNSELIACLYAEIILSSIGMYYRKSKAITKKNNLLYEYRSLFDYVYIEEEF